MSEREMSVNAQAEQMISLLHRQINKLENENARLRGELAHGRVRNRRCSIRALLDLARFGEFRIRRDAYDNPPSVVYTVSSRGRSGQEDVRSFMVTDILLAAELAPGMTEGLHLEDALDDLSHKRQEEVRGG